MKRLSPGCRHLLGRATWPEELNLVRLTRTSFNRAFS